MHGVRVRWSARGPGQPPADATESLHFGTRAVTSSPACLSPCDALPGTIGVSVMPPDPATLQEIDRNEREQASTVAADGAEFARSVGLVAEPQAVPDEVDVATR